MFGLELLEIIKIVFLFLAVFFTFVNISRMFYKNELSFSNFFLWTVGVVGFIYLQFLY